MDIEKRIAAIELMVSIVGAEHAYNRIERAIRFTNRLRDGVERENELKKHAWALEYMQTHYPHAQANK